MPEYLTLTSTKMETTSSFASAKTIVRVCFVLFLNPTSLLQKPVSQVEENNLSRMLLALGSRIAFATGGEQSGGGPCLVLVSFYAESKLLVYHLDLSPAPHSPLPRSPSNLSNP